MGLEGRGRAGGIISAPLVVCLAWVPPVIHYVTFSQSLSIFASFFLKLQVQRIEIELIIIIMNHGKVPLVSCFMLFCPLPLILTPISFFLIVFNLRLNTPISL